MNNIITWKVISFVLLSVIIIQSAFIYDMNRTIAAIPVPVNHADIVPSDGIVLAAEWGDMGAKMTEAGVIDMEKFEALYKNRGGMSEGQRALLSGKDNGKLKIDAENSGLILNLFWALGIGNNSPVLMEGPMQKYGDAGRFASTGGWSLSTGEPMDHYGKYDFIKLTPEQKLLVEEVAKNIYRPCCDNSTYFPDCNHGMAMLGFLQMLASQGATEAEMYKQSLALNTYWFPETYVNIAQYFQNEGTEWKDVDPKTALSAEYSSGSGYANILKSVQPQSLGGGGGCSV